MSEIDRIKELFLYDIIVAIAKIKYIANKFDNPEDLKYDFLHWDSIIREFEIVGEAMNYCIKFNLFENEKDKRKVIDFRNILIHKYFGIDPEAVLNIAKTNLDWLEHMIYDRIKQIEPQLKEELKKEMIEENKNLDFVKKALDKIQ
ncbi:HepT-like ribonuclease domain-containing protein [Caminibacter pacificus]